MNEPKPFDHTKPFRQRNGRPARLLAADVKDEEYPLAVAITFADGTECIGIFTMQGWSHIDRNKDKDINLVNLPERPDDGKLISMFKPLLNLDGAEICELDYLNLCHRAEKSLAPEDRQRYAQFLYVACAEELGQLYDAMFSPINASWQQRVIALCQLHGLEI